MSDKIQIIYSPLADFSTAPWGVLKVVDRKVVLDKVKAFNRARRMLNAGANMFRILRCGVWETTLFYDHDVPGYWDTLRKYIGILHQPYQTPGLGKGVDIIVEFFDGCSEYWMYDDYPKARKFMQTMFGELAYLPHVKFGVGNELNKPESVDFVEKVVYPEFKRAKIMPLSYGATYKRTDPPSAGLLEKQKARADQAWQMETSKIIYRAVHGVMDAKSENLLDTFEFWAKKAHPIRIIWSVDGVFDGLSDCDWTTVRGKIQRRPGVEQWRSAIRFILNNAKQLTLSGGVVKYGFEYLPKAVNKDTCSARGIETISEEYIRKFGKWPENWDKYPDDWIEPQPPTPPAPTPPEPGPREFLMFCKKSDEVASTWCIEIEKRRVEPGEVLFLCDQCKRQSWLKRLWHWLFGENSVWGGIWR